MKMDVIYNDAVSNIIQHLSEQIGMIKSLANIKPTWSKPKKLFKKKRGKQSFTPFGVPTGTIGVYRIIYEPTMETMSIGCGIVGPRLGRHRSVFLNKGKVMVSKNSYSGSQTGTLMYQHDRHRKNWSFSWCSIGNKQLSEEYEKLLQKIEDPDFNTLSMAGK